MIYISNTNSYEVWEECKCRASILRENRKVLHPALAGELLELERYGY